MRHLLGVLSHEKKLSTAELSQRSLTTRGSFTGTPDLLQKIKNLHVGSCGIALVNISKNTQVQHYKLKVKATKLDFSV